MSHFIHMRGGRHGDDGEPLSRIGADLYLLVLILGALPTLSVIAYTIAELVS